MSLRVEFNVSRWNEEPLFCFDYKRRIWMESWPLLVNRQQGAKRYTWPHRRINHGERTSDRDAMRNDCFWRNSDLLGLNVTSGGHPRTFRNKIFRADAKVCYMAEIYGFGGTCYPSFLDRSVKKEAVLSSETLISTRLPYRRRQHG